VIRRDRALVLGGASCVWDDVLELERMLGHAWDGVVVAANDVGAHWPRDLHHWASLHPYKLPAWMELREQQIGGGVTYELWTDDRRYHTAIVVDHAINAWPGGSSGMLALQVAKEIGCTRAVLCGIPMTPTGHFIESVERFHPQWVSAPGHMRAWRRHLALIEGWARSMSGATRELLGAPTPEWLAEA
jgi:hypothetical protein